MIYLVECMLITLYCEPKLLNFVTSKTLHEVNAEIH